MIYFPRKLRLSRSINFGAGLSLAQCAGAGGAGDHGGVLNIIQSIYPSLRLVVLYDCKLKLLYSLFL